MAKLLSLSDRILLGLSLLGDVFEDVATTGGLAGLAYKNVYGFVPRRYQKSYFVEALSRKVRTGEMKKIIRNGEVYLSLTRRGQDTAQRLFPYRALQSQKWDGEWLVVIFDIPEKKKRNREALRNKLYELGFGKLQRSVFISPFNVYEDLVEFLENWELSKQALVIESKKLWVENEKEMVERIWKVSRINKAYKELVKEAGEKENDIKEWTDKYFETLLSDPFLPKQLISSDWAASEAGDIFKKLIEQLGRG